jgi:PPOX class probable F420-dependent enzyme
MDRVPTHEPAARIDQLLRREPIVWLSTVRADGRPHLVPIWFSWDGARLFVASKPGAVKVRNLRANPGAMLALGEAEDDFDVGLVEALAELPDARTCDLVTDAHFAKYERQLAEIGLSREEYVATYSQPIVITPTRFLPWHGRTTPTSAQAPASAPVSAQAPVSAPVSAPASVAGPRVLDRVRGWFPRLLPRALNGAGA